MPKTVKEAMKGKKDKLPVMGSLSDVLKAGAKHKNLKSLKVKMKFK